MDGEYRLAADGTRAEPCLIQEPETPGFKCVVMPIKI